MNTLIFLLATSIGNPPATPLRCPATVAAKGDVKGGPSLVHAFELTHHGTGTLTITKVEAACGCLRQSLTSGVLAPGETAKLTLEVNTLTQPDGPNRWQIAVGYKVEAPGTPAQVGELLLQITATLSREVTVSPPQLGFSTTGTAKQVVSVKDSRGKPLTVLKATTTSPHLMAEVASHVAGKGQEVTVMLSADAPNGHRDEAVVLTTDDPAYPELRVPVRVLKRAAGGVRVAPESISLRFAPGQTELSTLVQLRSADGKPIEIAAAESDLPGVAIKQSTGTGAVAVVRVTVEESASCQSGACKVRVKLSQPTAQEIVIPVAWTRAIK
jgi:hypothetical protein